MDFDIGNLIYIIATIVAIAVGLLGKKKKPAVTSPPVESEPEKKRTFLDILGKELEGYMDINKQGEVEEIGEVDEFEAENEIESWEEDYVAKEPETFQSEYEGMNSINIVENLDLSNSISERNAKPLEVLDLDEEEEDYTDEPKREFDLETAIIYSTIINRKEY